MAALKEYDISTGFVATLYFNSLDAIKVALASPQGQAAAGDLANFADGGAELWTFECGATDTWTLGGLWLRECRLWH
jgi:uncharacterized protein (TIGR02118 family)